MAERTGLLPGSDDGSTDGVEEPVGDGVGEVDGVGGYVGVGTGFTDGLGDAVGLGVDCRTTQIFFLPRCSQRSVVPATFVTIPRVEHAAPGFGLLEAAIAVANVGQVKVAQIAGTTKPLSADVRCDMTSSRSRL